MPQYTLILDPRRFASFQNSPSPMNEEESDIQFRDSLVLLQPSIDIAVEDITHSPQVRRPALDFQNYETATKPLENSFITSPSTVLLEYSPFHLQNTTESTEISLVDNTQYYLDPLRPPLFKPPINVVQESPFDDSEDLAILRSCPGSLSPSVCVSNYPHFFYSLLPVSQVETAPTPLPSCLLSSMVGSSIGGSCASSPLLPSRSLSRESSESESQLSASTPQVTSAISYSLAYKNNISDNPLLNEQLPSSSPPRSSPTDVFSTSPLPSSQSSFLWNADSDKIDSVSTSVFLGTMLPYNHSCFSQQHLSLPTLPCQLSHVVLTNMT
jgi:hypothetical protein